MTTTGRDERPCPYADACGSCRCDANIFGTARVRHVGGLTLTQARGLASRPVRGGGPSRPPAAPGATEQGAPGTGAGVLPAWVQRRVDAAVTEVNERLAIEFDLPPDVKVVYEATEGGPAV